MKRHWSEYTSCTCGATFRVGTTAEARHRHNFPLLCKSKPFSEWKAKGYKRNRWANFRRMPKRGITGLVDVVQEGKWEHFNVDPTMAFIGPGVYTHWRPAKNPPGAET